MTGYLTGNYTTAFNEGKQQEVEMRAKHLKVPMERVPVFDNSVQQKMIG